MYLVFSTGSFCDEQAEAELSGMVDVSVCAHVLECEQDKIQLELMWLNIHVVVRSSIYSEWSVPRLY